MQKVMPNRGAASTAAPSPWATAVGQRVAKWGGGPAAIPAAASSWGDADAWTSPPAARGTGAPGALAGRRTLLARVPGASAAVRSGASGRRACGAFGGALATHSAARRSGRRPRSGWCPVPGIRRPGARCAGLARRAVCSARPFPVGLPRWGLGASRRPPRLR